MATIKAAFKKGKEVTLRDITLRELRADEIRIKVTACGICGTDLQVCQVQKTMTPDSDMKLPELFWKLARMLPDSQLDKKSF